MQKNGIYGFFCAIADVGYFFFHIVPLNLDSSL